MTEQPRSRPELSFLLGWAAVALEVVAVVVIVTWVWAASDPTFLRVWGSVLSYFGGGFVGLLAVLVAGNTSPAGRGRIPGLVALIFVIVTFALMLVALLVLSGQQGFGE